MILGVSMLWFWIAYIIVTLVGIGHTCFNAFVLKMDKDTKRPIKTMYDIKSYAATVKFHPLYNIILWPIFSYLYFIMTKPEDLWFEAFLLGLSWSIKLNVTLSHNNGVCVFRQSFFNAIII